MQSIERSVKSIRTSRREELAIVLVQLLDKRVLQDLLMSSSTSSAQVINVFGEFACYTRSEKFHQFVLNALHFSLVRRVMLHFLLPSKELLLRVKHETPNVRYSLRRSNAFASTFFERP